MYSFADAGRIRRAVRLAVTTRPVAWLSARLLPHLDRITFRLTGGRITLSAWVTGLPVVRLGTTGARSGLPRTVRVLAVPDGDALVVIAANFGQQNNPSWYHNIRAHPTVSVAFGGAPRAFAAEELHGAARDHQFARALAMNPGWSRFRDRAGRTVPVVRLTPAPASS